MPLKHEQFSLSKFFSMINYFVFPCVSVAFALRDAVKASREEFGLEGDQGIPGWIHLCKDMIMFCIIQQPDNLIQYIYMQYMGL